MKKKDLIKVTQFDEQQDGSTLMVYHVTNLGEEVFQKLAQLKKKKFCTEFINTSIKQALKEALKNKKKDGFSLGN